MPTNIVFRGQGGLCEQILSGDAVVRYDQLAERWLLVLPSSGAGPRDRTSLPSGRPVPPCT
ncbi:MAG: hypothetical protein R3E98_19305 [Gemmatimonadota bacterium]